jgi:hypothetical protein
MIRSLWWKLAFLTLALCAALILPALLVGRGQPNGDLLAYIKFSRGIHLLDVACVAAAGRCPLLAINPDDAAVWLPPARTDVFVSGSVGDLYLRRDNRTHRLTYDSINLAPAWQPSANR